jgi:hypothetical protein
VSPAHTKERTTVATDFRFSLENRPGSGARVLSALGQAGVNVIGVAAVSGGATVHLAVDDGDAARTRQTLEGAGVSIERESQVAMVAVEDRPGAGGALLQRIADAGVNVEFVYLATNTRIILGADDPQAIEQALRR